MMWWWYVFGFFSLILLTNVLGAYRLTFMRPRIKKTYPKVSLLIPVRNEERHIPQLCASLKTLTYPHKEIIFLDDHSTDATRKLIEEYQFKVIKGKKLPSGWIGKNWACHQLSEKATGEYLLFVDADVRIYNNSIEHLIDRADLVSVFPKYTIKTVGELLTVPLIHWMALTFLSWPVAQRITGKRFSSYTAANGQCVMIRKSMYAKIGGHEHIKFHIVEDIQLARETKKKGGKVLCVLGNHNITCRPYVSFQEGFFGFTKNMYPAMGNIAVASLFLLVFIVFLIPFIQFWYWQSMAALAYALVIAVLARQTPVSVILFPIQLTVWIGILLTSYYQTQRGVRTWKGRMY